MKRTDAVTGVALTRTNRWMSWLLPKVRSFFRALQVTPMTRRSPSGSLSPRPAKRAKLDHLTLDDFKNGVFLAPMVRSGARM
jgi:hypothetical protein